MFSSRDEKLKHLTSPNLMTSAFAHVAVAIIYRLDALTKHAGFELRVTPDILAGIFDGSIQYWNHSLIKAANAESQNVLPFLRIRPVVRSASTDTNSIFLRYLSNSPSFMNAYPDAKGTDYRNVNFTSKIGTEYLVGALSNHEVDSSVRFYDGAIGYYTLVDAPNSLIAALCTGSGACNYQDSIRPDDKGYSIHVNFNALKLSHDSFCILLFV